MPIQTKTWAQDRHILESEFGIHLPFDVGYTSEMRANDAALTPVTMANAGIPSQFTTYLEPSIIDVLTSPPKAAQIYGEARKGDWLHDTMQFVTLENAGEVAPYGDWSNSGYSNVNANFPQRQQFLVQIFSEVGDRESGRARLINVDLASKKRRAAVEALNYWNNETYFFGVNNLENYGSLTDPNLPTPITPKTKASGSNTWEDATAVEVYNDILMAFTELQKRNKGLVNLDSAVNYESKLKLVLPTDVQGSLLKTNEYGYSVTDLLKKNFPNLIQESAPQLSLPSGNLMQLFVEEYNGERTFTCAFSEKLRSHGIFRESSSIKEKLTQGSWGTILIRPTLVVQMQGI